MENNSKIRFLNNFRLFSTDQKSNLEYKSHRNTSKKKKDSSLTLFFIHPNILFPHPKSSHQNRLIKRTKGTETEARKTINGISN